MKGGPGRHVLREEDEAAAPDPPTRQEPDFLCILSEDSPHDG